MSHENDRTDNVSQGCESCKSRDPELQTFTARFRVHLARLDALTATSNADRFRHYEQLLELVDDFLTAFGPTTAETERTEPEPESRRYCNHTHESPPCLGEGGCYRARECPQCDGQAFEHVPAYADDVRPGQFAIVTCRLCHGRGEVDQQDRERYLEAAKRERARLEALPRTRDTH